MSEWQTDGVGSATGNRNVVSAVTPGNSPNDRTDSPPLPEAAQPDSRESLQAAVAKLQKYVERHDSSLRFRIDQTTDRVVVSIIDAATGELIRQIPAETTLRLARQVDQGYLSLLDSSLRA